MCTGARRDFHQKTFQGCTIEIRGGNSCITGNDLDAVPPRAQGTGKTDLVIEGSRRGAWKMNGNPLSAKKV
jgi:hypothetical protein